MYVFQLGEQSQCDLNSNFTSSGANTFIHEQRYNFKIISVLLSKNKIEGTYSYPKPRLKYNGRKLRQKICQKIRQKIRQNIR